MTETKVKLRRLGFGLRVLALFSLIFCVLSFLYIYPASLYLLGAGVLGFVVAGWIYYLTPVEEVYLFNKIDKLLYFTSLQNPILGVGKTHDPTNQIFIENIERLTVFRQYAPNVGSFLCVDIYLKNGEQHRVWLELNYTTSVVENIQEILRERKAIEVFCPDMDIYRRLSEYGDRVMNKKSPPIDDTISTRINYRDKFNDDEWRLLLDAPIRIFLFIANVDGKISPKELKTLTNYIHSSQAQRSLLFSEILHTVAEEINDVQFDYYESQFCGKMGELIDLVSMKVENTEVEFFKKALADYAYGIAKADNPKEEVPAMTEYKLRQMQTCLKM